MKERRAEYRVRPVPAPVKVAMAQRGGEYVSASVIDLTARGMAISVSESRMPALAIGTSVDLRFEIPGADPLAGILGVVRNERDEDGQRIFGLEIIDWRALHDFLPPNLFSAFNRRTHFRVSLPDDPATEVAVSTTDAGEPITATMANISAGGCLLLFQLGDAPESGTGIQVQFTLPGSGQRHELSATIRSAAEYRGAVQCGVEFDFGQSENGNAQQTQISKYVMKRQRETRPSR